MKRLFRSRSNRVFSGVCGGLGDYFNADPVVFRLIWILVTFFTGMIPGIASYLVATIIIPLEQLPIVKEASAKETV